MRGFRPLTPWEARGSLAHRLGRVGDRVRQRVSVRLGVNARRVFLVWTRWGGVERGEGDEVVLLRAELLPTPRVSDASSISRRQWSVGAVPEGSVRVDRVSALAYTEDVLRGLRLPAVVGSGVQPVPGLFRKGKGGDVQFDKKVDFFYEVVEDGRGDDPPLHRRFSLLGDPWRRPDGVEWVVLLQRADRDPSRQGQPQQAGAF